MLLKIKNLLKNIKHSRGKSFWSETGEDIILKSVFNSNEGKYIDIGSGQPIIGSNTFPFYKLGWTGICVDPTPNLELSWRILRPKDLFLPYVISNEKIKPLYEFENPLLSTTNHKVAQFHKSRGKPFTTRMLRGIKLKDYLPKIISPEENFFISIDVEGSELLILKNLNFVLQRPRALLIESWEFPWHKSSKISSYLQRFDYNLIAYTGLTALFVPKEINLKTFEFRLNLSKNI